MSVKKFVMSDYTETLENFKDMIVKSYTSQLTKTITDTKYGTGASSYIVNAIQYYFHK